MIEMHDPFYSSLPEWCSGRKPHFTFLAPGGFLAPKVGRGWWIFIPIGTGARPRPLFNPHSSPCIVRHCVYFEWYVLFLKVLWQEEPRCRKYSFRNLWVAGLSERDKNAFSYSSPHEYIVGASYMMMMPRKSQDLIFDVLYFTHIQISDEKCLT